MHSIVLNPHSPGRLVLERLVDRHGAGAILAATLAAMLRRRRARRLPRAEALSDHLRRDIGLPPLGAPQRHLGLL